MGREVFDELLALRRLGVALRRNDWRMFDQGLVRLRAEIDAGSAFVRHADWQACLQESLASDDLPEALKESLRDAIARLLSLEVRVATPMPVPSDAHPASVASKGGLALVAAWQSSLNDPAALAAFRAWLTQAGASRGPIATWLAEPDAGLAALANRANLTLAAREAGLAIADPAWVETFYAGLAASLAHAAVPFPGEPADLLAAGRPVSLLLAEPATGWEARYPSLAGDGDPSWAFDVLRLAGALDWFFCPHCLTDRRGATNGPLVIACPGCGGPAWPLVVPLDNGAFMPPALRNEWERAARALRDAATWVLLAPPLPAEGAFQAWLLDQLAPGKRVFVVGGSEASLKAWQARLAGCGLASVVTSQGTAEGVLGFLLRGGADTLLAPAGDAAEPLPATAPGPASDQPEFKKKPRR